MAKKPEYIELNTGDLNKTAIQYNQEFYKDADTDAYARLGNLYPARDANVASAGENMQPGFQDPKVLDALRTTGVGGADIGKSVFQQGRNLYGAAGVLDKDKRDRSFFRREFVGNPLRGFSMNQDDYVNAELARKKGHVDFQNALGAATARAAQIEGQNDANTATAALGAAGGIATGLTNFLAKPPPTATGSTYLSPKTYSYSPPGGYGSPGFDAGYTQFNSAPSNIGGAFEGTIGGTDVYRATPVDASSTGSSSL